MYLLTETKGGKMKIIDEDSNYYDLYERNRSVLPRDAKNKIDKSIKIRSDVAYMIVNERREIADTIHHLREFGNTITFINKDRLKLALQREGMDAEFSDVGLVNNYMLVRAWTDLRKHLISMYSQLIRI